MKIKLKKIGFWLWLPVRFSCWVILWVIRTIITLLAFIGWGPSAAADMWVNIDLGK